MIVGDNYDLEPDSPTFKGITVDVAMTAVHDKSLEAPGNCTEDCENWTEKEGCSKACGLGTGRHWCQHASPEDICWCGFRTWKAGRLEIRLKEYEKAKRRRRRSS